MKRLGFISNPLRCANCIYSWESTAMAVKYLFIGGDRLNNGQLTEIDHDFGYVRSGLLNQAPERYERSGWYRLKTAVPI